MKPFQYVSPSQISTFRGCARQWYFQSILGIRPPQKPSAALGEAVHKHLETYMLEGILPDPLTEAGTIARTGVHLLPAPKTADVELDIGKHPAGKELKLAGVAITGRIDLLWWRDIEVPETIDHKTTASFHYAQSEETLVNDPQMLLYSGFLLNLLRDRPKVAARHVQYKTRFPYEARQVRVEMSREHVRAAWAGHLSDTVSDMKKAAVLPDVAEVAPNWSACGKYGGCYFRDRCHTLRTTQTPGGQKPMSLLDIVKSGGVTTAPAPTPAPVKPPAAAPAPAQNLATGIVPPDAPPRDEKVKIEPKKVERTDAEVERIEREAIQNEANMKDTPGDVFGPATASNRPEPVSAPVEETPPAKKEAKAKKVERKGLTLYIDCFPERGGEAYTLLEDWLQPFAKQICEQENVPYWNLVPYNRGAALLCAKALAAPPAGALVIQTRQPASAALLEVLRPMADVIVRGW